MGRVRLGSKRVRLGPGTVKMELESELKSRPKKVEVREWKSEAKD